MKHLLMFLAICLLPFSPPAAVADEQIEAAEEAQPFTPEPVKRKRLPAVGVQFHGTWSSYNDAQRAKVLNNLKRTGAKWVRIDVGWSMLQPNPGPIDPNSWGAQQIDRSISMAHARGLKVMGTLWLTPAWANGGKGERVGPDNAKSYANAYAWASRHWRGKVQAWEVWNEPNSSDFLVGANPTEYTRLLCASNRAVAGIPNRPKVVFGGTMYSDTPWIARTYKAGAKGCFDVMAVHPYVAPGDKGPNFGNGGTIWEFAHLRQVRHLMLSRGDAKPIWATEMGWSSHPNRGGEANWEKGVSLRQQARYSTEALRILRDRHPYVKLAIFYNERAKPGESTHQRGYGLMSENFKPKPVYWALKRLLT